ncbi:hypothetical protein TNCT_585781 [Trichonephila clavata]|uniref:Uncharacterized protein n=1 Tax=Trichonephila clavata TaxID=2740835 RepID=A0A8X6HH94_TRICU|nr:hypothetical protein TNCT_585781 [Trichonephila clavata]
MTPLQISLSEGDDPFPDDILPEGDRNDHVIVPQIGVGNEESQREASSERRNFQTTGGKKEVNRKPISVRKSAISFHFPGKKFIKNGAEKVEINYVEVSIDGLSRFGRHGKVILKNRFDAEETLEELLRHTDIFVSTF